jgi:alkanesulfonate monooxygenase SsuD/methylene tetrahydromethanopterin reductase-like flavin-dependent oxidoreductase (luciferase family)
MKWSVLDQSPASAGRPEETAIRDSLTLARDCDSLGYERYRVSEHHNAASIVGTAPEVLMAVIGAPGRIDLGVGRAPGSDGHPTAYATMAASA